MDHNLMTIREMREEFDVTARTLRFYETKELLSPIRDGQKRLFTKRDRVRLTLILRAKRFGFSLEDIRKLLDLYNPDDKQKTQLHETYKLAQSRLAEMQQQRDELTQTIHDLEKHLVCGANLIADTAQANAA